MPIYYRFLFALALAHLIGAVMMFPPVLTVFACGLFFSLSWASSVDLKRMEIPDTVSIGLFPAGALWVLIQMPDALYWRLGGAMAVLVVLFLFGRAFHFLRGQEGLGFGDVKLIASSTVWIGISNISLMILLAACSGIIVSITNMRRVGEAAAREKIPFGPHLAFSLWIVWFWTTQTSLTF
ncbi:A24 family peptidase [Labrenzia sp. PHM005]|uniref:prepilin peptidase n=1 Tax=Labrenzia sp. PHM005 TaxID=2590016 RepID=UPI00143D6DE5|nr:A24 family peptidase [Labrenzia sp. PHM005]